jgi:hypothetical protein
LTRPVELGDDRIDGGVKPNEYLRYVRVPGTSRPCGAFDGDRVRVQPQQIR